MKLNVLFSSGLGENRGGAQIALPSTGTTNRMASSHSVIAEPGAGPDLVGDTSLIHDASLTLGSRVAQAPGMNGVLILTLAAGMRSLALFESQLF